MQRRTTAFLIGVCIIVVLFLVWFWWPGIAESFLSRSRLESPSAATDTTPARLPSLGQFGDMFGALTSLFTVLAFFGVAIAAWLQYEGLRHQQHEIEEQQKVNAASLQLSALTAILNSQQQELDAATNEIEKHFLTKEVARTKGELRTMLKRWPNERMRPSTQFLNDGPLNLEDLETAIRTRFSYISHVSFRESGTHFVNRLIARGVNSINRFTEVLGDDEVIRKVEMLYIEELKRPPYRILDLGAIAEWASLLTVKSDAKTFDDLRLTLRNCKEANENKNAFRNLPHLPGTDEKTARPSRPCVAMLPDKTVKEFDHFNDLSKWAKQDVLQKWFLFVFDREINCWVRVDEDGKKIEEMR